MGLRIVTWNINGIRNPFGYQPWREHRTFAAMFDVLEADIIILQETKIQRKDLTDDMVLVPGWDCYFSLPKHEKGKFGVVIYTRQSICSPIRAEEGLSGILCPPNSSTSFCELPENQQIGGYPTTLQAMEAPEAPEVATDFALLDSEGRCVILEFPAFVLLGLYNPAMRDEARSAFRISFLNLLDIRIRNLVAMGKRVIVTGDLNVAGSEIDMANLAAELRKQGTTVEEFFSRPARRWFNHLLESGTVVGARDLGREKPVLHDICRAFHPERPGMYTHWETKINARPGNYGSRIDYILCSLDMKEWFTDSNIQEGLMGSDHCPVYAVINDKVTIDGKEVDILDMVNPPGTFVNGRRLQPYSTKFILPTSARLIPEFSGRRSIKDMFFSKPKIAPRRDQSGASEHKSTPPDLYTASPKAQRDTSQKSTQEDPETAPQATPTLSKYPEPTSATAPATASASARKSVASTARTALKRSKSGSHNVSTASPAKSKGQQSLKGFLKPQSGPNGSGSGSVAETEGTHRPTTPGPSTPTQETKSMQNSPTTSSPPVSKKRKVGHDTPDTGSGADITEATSATNADNDIDGPDAPAYLNSGNKDQPTNKDQSGTDTEAATTTLLAAAELQTPPRVPRPPATSGSTSPSFPIHDPIESKESWSRLFSKRAAPLCEGHREPCKTMQTKKPGVNCGRSFFICARPLGPTGAKETGTRWRCGSFIWCSDWTPGPA